MRRRITQFARESIGLCPFRGSYVREFELSHSNRVNRNNSSTRFAREDVALWPFYNSYVKKNANCLLENFFKRFSEITYTSLQHLQLNYASCNVMVDSLTFINFQENYQTTEIYFYSYHVTLLNKTISNYCVN